MTTNRASMAAAALALAAVSCSTSAPGGPSAGPVLQTDTFTGTARANGPGSCTGDSHAFAAAEGTIAVTLAQTSPPESMTAQICSVNSATECSLTRQRIDVGQTIEVPRNGFVQQTLSLLPLTCGTNAPPSPQPFSYVVTVRYLR